METNHSGDCCPSRVTEHLADRRVPHDQFAKPLLDAIRLIVRQELERARVPSAEEHRDVAGSKRALAVSKAEAATILGVSRRTIDYSIALKRINVFRVGRRVLVPIRSLEAVVRRGSLRTGRREKFPDEGA